MKSNAVAATADVTPLHLAAQGERITVPRDRLFKAPENVRVTPRSPESIEGLAALIKASGGVLHNLIAYAERKKGKVTGRYAVTAGGGRLEAFDLLVSKNDFDAAYNFPVLLVPQHLAVEVSLAENSGREPMHPADEYAAFQNLKDDGKSNEDIAAAYGVTPVVVARRLRLANVAPELFDLFRAGGIQLNQLMALAITEDHEKQLAVWNSASGWQRNPNNLRDALVVGAERFNANRFAKFVGMEVYEAAGGAIRRDLFSDENDGYVLDMPLMLQLAQDALSAKGEALVTAGSAAWFEVVPNENDYDRSLFNTVRTVQREPSEEEQAAIDGVEAEIAALESQLEALDYDGSEDNEKVHAQSAALDEKHDSAIERLQALEDALACLPEEFIGKTGAVVSVNHQGQLRVFENLIRRNAETGSNGATGDHAPAKKAKPLHSEKLVRMLTANRTAALRRVLCDRPDIALVALAAQLGGDLADRRYFGTRSVQISASIDDLKSHGGENVCASRAFVEFSAIEDQWNERLQGIDDLFSWLLEQDASVTTDLLAFCVARSVTTVQGREDGEATQFAPLAKTVGLNMSDWWTATADNYFNHVTKAVAVAVVTEAVSAEAAADLHAMKRAPLSEAASDRVSATAWLPASLRA